MHSGGQWWPQGEDCLPAPDFAGQGQAWRLGAAKDAITRTGTNSTNRDIWLPSDHVSLGFWGQCVRWKARREQQLSGSEEGGQEDQKGRCCWATGRD